MSTVNENLDVKNDTVEESVDLLDGLTDPDQPVVLFPIIDDNATQLHLAAAITIMPGVLEATADFLIPQSWTEKNVQEIVTMVLDFYKKTGKVPQPADIRIEIIKKYPEKKHRLIADVTLDQMEWTNFVPDRDTKAMIAVLAELTKVHIYKTACVKRAEAVTRYDFEKVATIEREEAIAIQKINDKINGADLSALMTGSEFFELCDQQENQWIVRDFFEVGDSIILSGLPYAGKSTLLCYLWECLALGKSFFHGETVIKTPIVYINSDAMKEKLLGTKIRNLIGEEDIEEFSKRYFYINPQLMPKVITPEFIASVCERVRKTLGMAETEPVAIFVDTMRSAYMGEQESGSENDSTIMGQILTPIRKVAKKVNAVIFNLHHNSRGKNEYAGSAAIAGATDGIWNLTRDDESFVAELSRQDRHECRATIKYQYDPILGFLLVEKPKSTTGERDPKVIKLFELWGDDGAKSKSEIMELIGEPDTNVRRIIQLAEEAGMFPRLNMITQGTISKSNPKMWIKA